MKIIRKRVTEINIQKKEEKHRKETEREISCIYKEGQTDEIDDRSEESDDGS